MEIVIEKIAIYGGVVVFLVGVVLIYIFKLRKESKIVEHKIRIAQEEGLYEPVSLHPFVDVNSCIQSGACIRACPEKDILGIRNGKATVINASRCVGHGACFHACPTHAITLRIGTDKRGVDLPHVNQYFESNVKGIYIAGEMGGMGLIKNSVAQGKQAVENLLKGMDHKIETEYDLIVVGAGPAGISATLEAKKHRLKVLTLEQDSLGGAVYTFPRKKIIMTSPMELPLYGKVKLYETSKTELLNLWDDVLSKNDIQIKENKKVEHIQPEAGKFIVKTVQGDSFTTKKVLLAIGRRGSPRKLNIPGEMSEKVAYRLLEPELIKNKKIVVVGGGDSAIETALLLADENEVTLSYRGEVFSRLKTRNKQSIEEAIAEGKINVMMNSNLVSIEEKFVHVKIGDNEQAQPMENDLVYIFAGGELPTQFLKNVGIEITTRYGEALLKH